MNDPACTTIVHSDGRTSLPDTGMDAAQSAPFVIVALLCIAVGVMIVLARSRRARAVGMLCASIVVAGLAVTAAPSAARADAPSSCALIAIDSVAAQSVDDLAPGDTADGVQYTITNVTAFTIDVHVTTAVTSDPGGLGRDLRAIVMLDGTSSAPTALAARPASERVRLAPGASARAAYTLSLPDTVDNARQGQTVGYDSVITAAQT